jgi:hypothetical protein
MNKPIPGYNPMRWDCQKQGCFNKKKRPKIEVFSECFPGKVSFGDVDGLVEINNHFLFLEWKEFERPLPMGQRLTYERITQDKRFAVFVVCGDPESMDVNSIQLCYGGKLRKRTKATLDALKQQITNFVKWAEEDESGQVSQNTNTDME